MSTVDATNGSAGRAQARFVRVSPRKARLVVDNIRGRSVPEARTILAFTSRAAAIDVEKVLRSAVANAEVAAGRSIGDDLVISAAFVDEGPTIKRWRARARGKVASIKKRTCHITVVVSPAAQRQLDSASRPQASKREEGSA